MHVYADAHIYALFMLNFPSRIKSNQIKSKNSSYKISTSDEIRSLSFVVE